MNCSQNKDENNMSTLEIIKQFNISLTSDHDKATEVLSLIPSPELTKATSITPTAIWRLKNGKSTLENSHGKTIMALCSYYDELVDAIKRK